MIESLPMMICLFAVSATLIDASCFTNGTLGNTTSSPCLVGAFLPHQFQPQVFPSQFPYYPMQVYPQQVYPSHPSDPVYLQQLNNQVTFPQTGYQQSHYPYYRPTSHRSGYSYPSDYRGPQSGWSYDSVPHHQHHQHQPHLSPIPPRYSMNYGYPNFSPVPPVLQRRTYVVNNRPDNSKEPIFMDRGSFLFVGRDAELTCGFYDNRFRVVSNVAWVKVTGPYEFGSLHPPFECHRPGCKYLYINGMNDFRFRVITLGQTSTLRIYDYNPGDQGVYRCAATAQSPDRDTTVTIYKIIEFFNIRGPHLPAHISR